MKCVNKQLKIIVLLVIALFITLIFRIQTFSLINSGLIPQVLTPDPWYILKQIDLASHSHLSYSWFDPFTNYPQGAFIHWGPLLPITGTIIALITGNTQTNAMTSLVSWLPVMIAILTIPLVYYFGRHLHGDFCGISAAILIAVIPGSYLIRSMYGYVDHHILESFFMLAYASGFTLSMKGLFTDHAGTSPGKKSVIYGTITGLILGLGMLNSQTMIIAAGISILFVLVFGIQLIKSDKNTLNIVLFLIPVSCIGALLTIVFYTPDPAGPKDLLFDPIFLAFTLFLPSVVGIYLAVIQAAFRKKKLSYKWIFPAIFAGGIFTYIIGLQLIPNSIQSLKDTLFGIATPASSSYAIAEYLPLSPDVAFFNYHIMLILFIPGLLLLLYEGLRKTNPIALYLLLWSGATGILTVINTRYEILLAVPLTLTIAFLLSWIFTYQKTIPETSEKENTIWQDRPGAIVSLVLLIGTCTISLCIAGMVATADYNYQPYVASEDWIEGLLWMKNETPDPGVNYYQVYHADSFRYPDSAYGVLSWWDYGHWITTIAHRMAVTNPFQANLDMAAQFFMSRSEKPADIITSENSITYIISDADMLFDTMQMMMRVYSPDATPGQYMGLISINDTVTGKPVSSIGYRQPFYESMVTRLHVFDGSSVQGEEKILEQEGTPVPGTDMLVIFPGGPDPEISESIIRPLKDIEALQHYRLIWESNTSLSTTDEHDIRKVKIFERVPGAIIQGEGTIELPIITNRGREFTYRQQSINGTFILPYSTNKTAWPVHATGPYRIKETGKVIEVSETMVQRSNQ
ncbi:oligosaccharyl transferase, archaeosortase A system-associated [Methanospirillum hungatei]|uniref:oligosaccharyl transferase, archaeosortase A system-associated n=1 Tax=Methanospirillum hungatei TaxID=2203 RepID=UPI0026F36D93|nr:oligosaccharyl transferase, archaeosortase A system-associated [Methanospirillum hungatei]MCA1916273.1 oligosaccharyl transferase, archaeosortase A system-associated [Methanospirillum hungatei]